MVATNNPGKLREFRRLLAALPWRLVSLAEAGWTGELDEPGETYAENALAKAAAVAAALELPALADDSGIEVDALRGWPGPLSARWLGPDATDEDRLRGLIAAVDERTPDDRRVRYVCVVALCRPAGGAGDRARRMPRHPGGATRVARLRLRPAFLSDDLGITFGEADDSAKDRVSHRARALHRLEESGILDKR